VSNTPFRRPRRDLIAIALAVLVSAVTGVPSSTASSPDGVPPGPGVDAPSLASNAGCTPDPETGEAYCGERDAAAPEAAELRAEPPLTTTLAGVRAGSRTALEEAASTLGLSDQNDPAVVNAWRDPRATGQRGLHLREGRLVVPWNVYARAKATNPDAPASTATRAGRDLDRWRRALLEMKRGGFDTPIISFERQRDVRTSGVVARQPLPTPSEYLAARGETDTTTAVASQRGHIADALPGVRSRHPDPRRSALRVLRAAEADPRRADQRRDRAGARRERVVGPPA
jgi:hypothetical protein